MLTLKFCQRQPVDGGVQNFVSKKQINLDASANPRTKVEGARAYPRVSAPYPLTDIQGY
jgi:hypothetical protein